MHLTSLDDVEPHTLAMKHFPATASTATCDPNHVSHVNTRWTGYGLPQHNCQRGCFPIHLLRHMSCYPAYTRLLIQKTCLYLIPSANAFLPPTSYRPFLLTYSPPVQSAAKALLQPITSSRFIRAGCKKQITERYRKLFQPEFPHQIQSNHPLPCVLLMKSHCR